jgi:hypothetical protein
MNGIVALHLLPMRKDAAEKKGTLLRSAHPIQGAACFLSATSGLCSVRHSYVLLFVPYLRIQRSPLVVVLTLWLGMATLSLSLSVSVDC